MWRSATSWGIRGIGGGLGIVAVIGVAFAVGGCSDGEPMGRVRGRVTLDGKPVENALIEFLPIGGGDRTSSYGATDANGNYEMRFSDTRAGVMLGKYRVQISTGDPYMGMPEKFPPAYNAKSELVVDVESGRNVFDFDCDSGGFTPVELDEHAM